MKIKELTKQFSLKKVNTNGTNNRNDFTSIYSGPPLSMASKQIENGLLNCKQLPNSKMFYMSNSTINTAGNNNISNNNNDTISNFNNHSYQEATNNHESVYSLLSKEEQIKNNSKSIFIRMLLPNKYKSVNNNAKRIQKHEIPSTSNRNVTFIEFTSCKSENLNQALNEPEYIQMKPSLKHRTKSLLFNTFSMKPFTCSESNTNFNICSNLSDYIHANDRRKQMLMAIIVIFILLLIIMIITMIVLYNQFDESLVTLSLSPSSSSSSSSSTLSPVNRLSNLNKPHFPPLLSSSLSTTDYMNSSSSSSDSMKDQKCKTQKFCLNISCLQIASILAERLGRYNRPKSLMKLLDKCSPEQVDEIIKIFYIGDEFHLSNSANSLHKFKQKRLFNLWSYVSDQLQSYIIEDKNRPLLLWTEKLAYLFQRLIDQYMFKKNITNTVVNNIHESNSSVATNNTNRKLSLDSTRSNIQRNPKMLLAIRNTSLLYSSTGLRRDEVSQSSPASSSVSFLFPFTVTVTEGSGLSEFDTISRSYHTEFEQLNALLQMGNIAFHGLDNVLVNVQLNLRVPLFFSAWIARSHTPGLMDSFIPMLNHPNGINSMKSQTMTLRELMQVTQHTINFPRYLGRLTSWNHLTVMPRDMQVLVVNVDYYDKLGRMLQQTSFSELQDYITFAILHKYGAFVDQQTAQLKSKFLKPYAESLGMEQVSYWPFLLDLASPGLKLILQSRWSLSQLNHAIKQFHSEILIPVQTIIVRLLNISMDDPMKCNQLINKISSMKIQLMSHNDHIWMEDFYSELNIHTKQSLLMQLVSFNNFLSKKAISTDLSKLIPDLGLSSGGSKLFQYIESSNIMEISLLLLQWPHFMPDLSIPRYLNFGYLWYSIAKIISKLLTDDECFNPKVFYWSEKDEFDQYVRKFLLDSKIMDNWISLSNTTNVFQSILAIEIAGRVYKEYLQANLNQPDSNLPGIFFTNEELFYQWIFQLTCPGFDYSNTITHNQVLQHSITECDAIRTALKLSPTFRWFMNCPQLSS
ncbi:unnamed protein product [Heterobilharzia americana]|nr:unnamed protein product [Heterobilharzia americana]